MTKHASIIAALSLVLLTGAGCASSLNTTVTPSDETSTPVSTEGRAVFTVTDASTVSDVTAVVLTINKLEVHSAANNWVTVSTDTKDYDLLKLKAADASELLADTNLEAGTYDQVRLNIKEVKITAGGKTVDAKLPSSVLKIVGNLTIVAGETSSASLDFLVDQSLHVTGSGTYIFAPVIKWQTAGNAEVTVDDDNSVEVKGGETETDETVGTDVDGETKTDFELPEDLDIDSSGHIKVKAE